jgi:hypothetical protein
VNALLYAMLWVWWSHVFHYGVYSHKLAKWNPQSHTVRGFLSHTWRFIKFYPMLTISYGQCARKSPHGLLCLSAPPLSLAARFIQSLLRLSHPRHWPIDASVTFHTLLRKENGMFLSSGLLCQTNQKSFASISQVQPQVIDVITLPPPTRDLTCL